MLFRSPIPADLRTAIQGVFDLGPLQLTIRDDAGRLMAQATGQQAFELFHDSQGDLYPTITSALLTPEFESGRIDRFIWRQMGGVVEARRDVPPGADRKPDAAVDPRWKDWLGDYAITPQFGLHLFQEDGRLKVRATGQDAFEATPAGTDRAEIAVVGAVLQFERDGSGAVTGVKLLQNGQVLPGRKH